MSQKYSDQKEQKAPDNPTLLVSIRINMPFVILSQFSRLRSLQLEGNT